MSSCQFKQRRKVQIQGKSSCTVSIPKKWVSNMGLLQGSFVTLAWHNSTSLLLSVERTPGIGPVDEPEEVRSLSIQKLEPQEAIMHKIASLYEQGYNLFKINLESDAGSFQKTSIKEFVQRQLIGAELISDSLDGMLVQVLLGKSDLTIENAMKRMSVVSGTMQRNAIEAIKLQNRKLAQEVLEDDEFERFGYYSSRHILGSINHDVFKEGDESDPEKLAVYLQVSNAIQNGATCAREIAEQALILEAPLEGRSFERLTLLGDAAIEIFDSAVLAFFKRDSKEALMTMARAKDFQSEDKQVLEGIGKMEIAGNVDQTVRFLKVLDSLKKIVQISSEIASLVLGLTTEQYSKMVNVISTRSPTSISPIVNGMQI